MTINRYGDPMIKKPRPYIKTITNKDKIFVAYLIVHTNTKKVYVGSSGQPGIRMKSHFRELKKGKHINYKLQKLYDEDPEFHTIFYKVKTRALAFDLEQALINYYFEKKRILNVSLSARFTRRKRIIREDGTVYRRPRRKYWKKNKFDPDWKKGYNKPKKKKVVRKKKKKAKKKKTA